MNPGEIDANALRPRQVGLLRRARRWILQHPGSVILSFALLLVVLASIQAWLANEQYAKGRSGPPPPEQIRTKPQPPLTLLSVVASWVLLHRLFVGSLRGVLAKSPLQSVNFQAAVRRRLVEGRPIRPGLLAAHGVFGAVGLVLGAVLGLSLIQSCTLLRSPAVFDGKAGFVVPLLALFVLYVSFQLIWDVFQQAELEIRTSEEAQQVAAAVLEAEQAEEAVEREEARKSIVGWPAVVCIGGLLGGVVLGLRLPEAAQAGALLAGFIGFEAAAVTMYLAKVRPRGRSFWQGLALALSAAGVVYLEQSFHDAQKFIVAGLVWGAVSGITAVLVYWRTIQRRERSQAATQPPEQ